MIYKRVKNTFADNAIILAVDTQNRTSQSDASAYEAN